MCFYISKKNNNKNNKNDSKRFRMRSRSIRFSDINMYVHIEHSIYCEYVNFRKEDIQITYINYI